MGRLVIDASAVLACIIKEEGAALVDAELLRGGCVMSSVNLSEAIGRLEDAGTSDTEARAALGELRLELRSFDEEAAYQAAALRRRTRGLRLSLGDRACLGLARQLRLPVLTADRAWGEAHIGVKVRFVR